MRIAKHVLMLAWHLLLYFRSLQVISCAHRSSSACTSLFQKIRAAFVIDALSPDAKVRWWRHMQLEAQLHFGGDALVQHAFGDFNRQRPARRLAFVNIMLALTSSPIASRIMHEAGECAAAMHSWLSSTMLPSSAFVHIPAPQLHFTISSLVHCLSL